MFELAHAIRIAVKSEDGVEKDGVKKVTLFTAASGREQKTSEELTVGLYMFGKPMESFLDWERTVEQNVVDAKKRAKGILEEPSYSSESDLSDALWISFRNNLGILKTLFKTPFHLYEAPRKFSPAPLLTSIEDMNESGEYNVQYDYWNNTYSEEQIRDIDQETTNILDLMVNNPKMTLKGLVATLAERRSSNELRLLLDQSAELDAEKQERQPKILDFE